jgi:CheY-like chemotaxis protein
VFTCQPACFPSKNGTIPAGTVTHPAASGRPTRIMQQAIRLLFARVADFLRPEKASTALPSSSPRAHSSMGPIAVVGLVVSYEDRQLLAGICRRNRWCLLLADTCEEARSALDKLQSPVILCDRDLPGQGWRQTVEDLAASPSRACVILVSAVVDRYLLDEVVRKGGYDVLSKPLREADVVRTVRLASLYCCSGARAMADLVQES